MKNKIRNKSFVVVIKEKRKRVEILPKCLEEYAYMKRCTRGIFVPSLFPFISVFFFFNKEIYIYKNPKTLF